MHYRLWFGIAELLGNDLDLEPVDEDGGVSSDGQITNLDDVKF